MRKSLTALTESAGLARLMKLAGLTLLTAALLFSCSDDADNNDDSGKDKPKPPTATVSIAVTLSDYLSIGNFEIISTDDYSVRSNLISELEQDNAVRAFNGDVYILERGGKDNIIKYNVKEMAPQYNRSLGEGLNLQDIAVVSETKAYISCYDVSYLIVFNPKTKERVSTIDLSPFNTYAGTDSAEATPYANSLAMYGNYVYVACQRLKYYSPADTSLIVVIDTRTDKIVTSINLNKQNPASMSVFGNKLLVSSSGVWFDATSAGVEMIDLVNNKNLGLIADGGTFGGSLGNIIFISQSKTGMPPSGVAVIKTGNTL